MIGASSWAAEFVTRHPLLLDELLDDRVLYAPPDWPAFEPQLRSRSWRAARGDTERQMNVLREQHQAQVFRLLAQDLAGPAHGGEARRPPLARSPTSCCEVSLETVLARPARPAPRARRASR